MATQPLRWMSPSAVPPGRSAMRAVIENSSKGSKKGESAMWITREESMEPMYRAAFRDSGTFGQREICSLRLATASSRSMDSSTSASCGSASQSPCSISRLNCCNTSSMKYPAVSIKPTSTTEESIIMTLERLVYHRARARASSSLLSAVNLADFKLKAPERTTGQTRRTTGNVPSSIWLTLRSRMPVSTEVGQSGPPHSTATFAVVRPSWLRMCLMAFMGGVWIATAFLTATLPANGAPIPFCCMTTPANFRKRLNSTANIQLSGKLSPSCSHR
mmetsp:Transcript_88753/g.271795  ORF Transcript_88753/g.271795 Transcript_88753/m.271795 type:complete len:275 (+) Transcript_88753:108-932(+)